MFRYHLNHARITFLLVPEIPFLVQSGAKGLSMVQAELTDNTALRTRTPDGLETVFVPGSSLKGMVRSAAERLLRTIAADEPSRAACDPLDQGSGCQREASKRGNQLARSRDRDPHRMGQVHRLLCYACRTFGSQAMASRVRFSDAFPADAESAARANETEVRNRVTIDRKTGGPGRGRLYDLEAVTGGSFRTTIHLENFQVWQLALLARVLRDVDDGFVRLGSSKTRGFGHVRVRPEELVVGQVEGSGSVRGVAALRPDLVEPYGLVTPDAIDPAAEGAEWSEDLPPFRRARWTGEEDVWAALDATRGEAWKAFVAGLGGGS